MALKDWFKKKPTLAPASCCTRPVGGNGSLNGSRPAQPARPVRPPLPQRPRSIR